MMSYYTAHDALLCQMARQINRGLSDGTLTPLQARRQAVDAIDTFVAESPVADALAITAAVVLDERDGDEAERKQ